MSGLDSGSRAAGPVDIPRLATTFVVRMTLSRAGGLVGNVQRVRTGERRAFHRSEAIGSLIAEMLASTGTDGGGDMPGSARHRPAEWDSATGNPGRLLLELRQLG